MRFRFARSPSDPPPDWVIVGLGNPGAEYSGTRHNVGFRVVDGLAVAHSIRLRRERQASAGAGAIGGSRAQLVKPLTYMNLSGKAVAPIVRRLSIPLERVLVVYDDMDLSTGRLRIRPHGGAGGHGGIKSLIESLQSQAFPRIRIGVGRPSEEATEHVLGPFDATERPLIEEAVGRAVQAVEMVMAEGLDAAMNRFNVG